MHVGGRVRRTRSHLGCRPPQGEVSYIVKGAVYSSKKKSVVLRITFYMSNTIIWFMEAKRVADKVKPPEEIG